MLELAVYGPPWHAVASSRDILRADPPAPNNCSSHLALAAYEPTGRRLVRAFGRDAVERAAYGLALEVGGRAYVLQGAIQTGSGRWLWPIATDVVEVGKQDPNPLDRSGFAVIVDSLRGDLVDTSGAAELRALTSPAARRALAANWPALSAAERELAISGLNDVVTGIATDSRFISEAAASLEAIAQSVTGAAILGSGGVSAVLSTPDAALARRIGRDGLAFVTNEYGHRGRMISQDARRIIARDARIGLGQGDIARNLRAALANRVSGRSEFYYRVVASSAVSRSRSFGQLRGYAQEGVETYRWEAVMDARTCLRGDSRVLMADGGRLPIRDVQVGDRVVSCCGKPQRVLATRAVAKHVWVRLDFSNGQRLHATPSHPVLTSRGWVRAGALRPGDRVISADELKSANRLRDVWERVRGQAPAKVLLEAVSNGSGEVSNLRQEISSTSAVSREGEDVLERMRSRVDSQATREDVPPLRQAAPERASRTTLALVSSAGLVVGDRVLASTHPAALDLWPVPGSRFAGYKGATTVVATHWANRALAEPAFDIQVEHDEGFIVETIVVHNCEICRFLHGQEFPVPEALERMERALSNPDPEAAVREMPWYRLVGATSTPEGLRAGGQIFVSPRGQGPTTLVATVRQSGMGENDRRGTHRVHSPARTAGGTVLPPAHGLCRCTTVAG